MFFMTKQKTRIIGVDAALTKTGLISLIFEPGKDIVIESKVLIETNPDRPDSKRLHKICKDIRMHVAELQKANPCRTQASLESPPQGASMYSSATVAKACAAGEIALAKYDQQIYMARAVKVFMVPDWPGTCKANWTKAGYTKKWKRSMPSKAAVASHLGTDYGLYIAQQDISDAASLAIYHAHKIGVLNNG